jgi:hypothetical protein
MEYAKITCGYSGIAYLIDLKQPWARVLEIWRLVFCELMQTFFYDTSKLKGPK